MKPILFNTEMVRAIQADRKTVTRRVLKDKDVINNWDCEADGTPIAYIDQTTGDSYPPTFPSPYQPGDILWVRETWCGWYLPHGAWLYRYKATNPNGNRALTGPEYDDEWEVRPWRPSIHMPREAARLFLRVTAVRVERLRDMCLADVLMEGIREADSYEATWNRWHKTWDSTIKPADQPLYGWEANPWVWVIKFERISKEAAMAAG